MVCVTAALAGLWLAVRHGPGAMAIYEGTGLLLAAIMILAVVRRKPPTAWAWVLLASAVALSAFGDLVYDLAEAAGDRGATSTLSNLLYLAGYPALILGALGLMRSAQRRRDATVLIDGTVYALAGWLAIWVLLVNPSLHTSQLSVLDWLPTVAYPPLDIVVLVVLFRVGQGGARWLTSWRLLVAAFTLMLIADTLYAALVMPDSGAADAALSVAYLFTYGLLAAAAVHPDMAELGSTAGHRWGGGSQWPRVAGLGLAAAVPALLLVVSPNDVLHVPLVTAIVGLVLVAGAVTRALLVLRRQREAERVLELQATHDPLTGLASRAALLDHLESTAARCRRQGRECAVLFCDLDQFKVINDTHGHGVGDELLVAVAARLRDAIAPDDTIGRLGGDEFVVITTSRKSSDGGHWDPAVPIRDAMRTPFVLAGAELHVTMSIGVVRQVQDSKVVPEAIISDADIAMYRAKDNGRDRVEQFVPIMYERMHERSSIEAALRVALTDEQFFLVFQPVVSLSDGSTIAEEALLRWDRPGVGVVMPNGFIGIAEASGLIADLGAWALRHSARHVRNLGFPVAVNVSARQLRDPEMAESAIAIVLSEGLSPARVVLEITETHVLEATETVRRNLALLRAAGFTFAIDDFGLGYSNIGALKKLDVATLKIDQSFVAGIDTGSGDETLIAAMITMAHALDMSVIAEGVEEPHQLETLRALGCDAAQGYLLGRPARAPELVPVEAPRRLPLS